MLFECLVLENFRAFAGRQALDLKPQPSRPIVLVAGLNGAGKTTVLEALYLVLYGKRTPSPRRAGKAYETYLSECVHRSTVSGSGTSVELRISQTLQGQPVTYDVTRSWTATPSGVREVLDVRVNDRLDPVLTEDWGQYIEDLLPSRLAPLFFFDGEKIENLADLDATSEVLSVAIQSLLGLDLVDRLDQDLDVLERRRVTNLDASDSGADLQNLQEEEERLELEAQHHCAEKSRIRGKFDSAEQRLRRAEQAFEQQGGAAFAQQAELEEALAQAHREAQGTVARLQQLASGVAPLLLIPDLLNQVADQAASERAARENQLLLKLLAQRDASLLESLGETSADPGDPKGIEDWLRRDREERRQAAELEPYLNLDDSEGAFLDHLLQRSLPELQEEIHGALKEHRSAARAVDQAEKRVASVPESEQLEVVRQEMDEARQEMALWTAERERAEQAYEKANELTLAAREQRKRGLRRFVESRREQSETRRVLAHSEKVRSTLKVFRQKVLERHIERIQELVLDGLHRLLRKRSLVTGLEIDPADFSVKLYGARGDRLYPGDLSAGERQLLATSLLWGLARASGRPIPTLIDTPLGRLDSVHRELLVDRYFPHASHQVILLSTDEEIAGATLDRLKDRIGRSYLLEHDDSEGVSRVQEEAAEGVLVG